MKKIVLLLFIAFTVNSCTVGDDSDRDFVYLPVESVTLPSSFTLGNISKIMVKYRRPTQCYIFNGFYYNTDGMERTIAISAVKLKQDSCPDDSESEYEMALNFQPMVAGTYTLRFWLGPDTQGVDQYATYEIEVQ